VTTTSPRSTRKAASEPTESILTTLGEIASFAFRTIRVLPATLRYPTEVVRQLAILLLSNAIPIWVMMLTTGFLLAEIGVYVLLQIGAQAYMGLFISAASVKATNAIFFGYIVAGKTATGFVAELGAMRINEEIDALEVMGVPSHPYLVGSRIWACLLGFPILSAVGNVLSFAASYVTTVYVYKIVSAGGYLKVFWSFVTPTDLMASTPFWLMGCAMICVTVGCYYGYTASGGPTGVGRNTARSMALNVTVVTLSATVFFQMLYGTGVILPIAN
jgi:phospholipid/cholesterol/gamma-HCH transport system permease protein